MVSRINAEVWESFTPHQPLCRILHPFALRKSWDELDSAAPAGQFRARDATPDPRIVPNESEFDQDAVAFHLDGVNSHSGGRIVRGGAGFHVILPPVPGTYDFTLVHKALTDRPSPVQADVVHGGERAAYIGDADNLVAGRKFTGLTFRRQVGSRSNFDELRHRKLGWSPVAGSQFRRLIRWASRRPPGTHFLPWLQRLRDHNLAFELLRHVRFQPNFCGPLGQRHLVNLVLQLQ